MFMNLVEQMYRCAFWHNMMLTQKESDTGHEKSEGKLQAFGYQVRMREWIMSM